MTSRKTQDIGRLDSSPARRSGKAIDEWTFTAPLLAKHETTVIKVKVHLVQGPDGLMFTSQIKDLGTFEDSDIQRLHVRIESALRQHSTEGLGIVWEDWLRVRVTSEDHGAYDKLGVATGLKIVVESIKRAVNPKTGEAFLLSANGMWTIPMPKPKSLEKAMSEELERKLKGAIQLDSVEEVSYVPATESNLAALKLTCERLQLLRTRLAQALSQSAVQGMLDTLNNELPKLAAPDEPNS